MRQLALLLLAILLTPAAFADDTTEARRIYRWVDQNGVAHYTTDLERVPEELRSAPLSRDPLAAQAPASTEAWIGQDRIETLPPPSSDPSAAATANPDRVAVLDARIAEIEQAITADEELLKGELTDAAAAPSNDTLKQVAERMPARIAELRKLQAERETLAPPSAE
jgi:hypothetical protein